MKAKGKTRNYRGLISRTYSSQAWDWPRLILEQGWRTSGAISSLPMHLRVKRILYLYFTAKYTWLDHKIDDDILRIRKPSLEIRNQLDAIRHRNTVKGKSRETIKADKQMKQQWAGYWTNVVWKQLQEWQMIIMGDPPTVTCHFNKVTNIHVII
jgi:hypothetical protein